ncbi:hypothetical protein [Roseomonas sp. SXEYE001]|uniref:hypothetical protein n=1 Tax=Roseomonas xinghualingensis TaxID=2986475 RepID=UPI0021F1AC8E|nr:hypothetical protein [Roseomonas sp. SXEYE001]MCV4207163.1 hypothetical protein [Roseomonas sp. SXEYE001]
MIDWTAILAALGLSAPVATVLGIGLRFALPSLVHAIRVWMIDLALKRAGGQMFSILVAEGYTGGPVDPARLERLLATGVRYMQNRLGETLTKVGVSAEDLRSMVQGAFGELLAKAQASPAATPAPADGMRAA